MFNDKSDHFGQYVGLYFTQEIDKKSLIECKLHTNITCNKINSEDVVFFFNDNLLC